MVNFESQFFVLHIVENNVDCSIFNEELSFIFVKKKKFVKKLKSYNVINPQSMKEQNLVQ